MSTESVIPRKEFKGTTLNMTMGEIVHSVEHYQDFFDKHDEIAHYRRILGFPLPPWQRDLVWTEEQCVRFIISAWEGLHLGTYVVNKFKFLQDGTLHPLSNLLIDGQQRIYAIARYIQDEFPVYGYLYSELPQVDIRRFNNVSFARSETYIYDEQELKDLYNKLNFGGTPHKPSERA